MIRGFLRRFMAGRYGNDQLNLALIITYLVLYLLSVITRLDVLYWIALVLVFVSIFRCLSRRTAQRRAENARYLQVIRPLQKKVKNFCVRVKDRDHRYFRCPNCKQQMRVPRGKGRITVHCRSCGATFEEKS